MNKKIKRGHKWPEFRHPLIPMTSDVLEDNAPYVFMDIDDLEAELHVIEAALPSYPMHRAKAPSRSQAMLMAMAFQRATAFGVAPTVDELTERLAHLQPRTMALLRARLPVLATYLRSACEIWGRDYEPSRTFAVNHRWDRRWASLLSGGLFVAFVGFLEIDQPPYD